MKDLRIIVALVLFSGLFLTSCEKDYMSNPLPGNTNQNGILKDGEAGTDDGGGVNPDDDEGDAGITDGGRDEDYDKSNKKKSKG